MPQEESARVIAAVEAWGRGDLHVDVEKLTDVRPPEMAHSRWPLALTDGSTRPRRNSSLTVLGRKDAYRR